MDAPLVIIGTGLAGYALLRALRHVDHRREICMIGADAASAWSRGQLHDGLARGREAGELVLATAEQMAHRFGATILPHRRVLAIDRERKIVRTDGGEQPERAWSQLVIATGAEALRPATARGSGAARILTVSSLAEYAYLRSELAGRRRVTVLGGGVAGCELAENLLRGGCEVSLLEPGNRLLGDRFPGLCADRVAGALHTAGVRLRLEDGVQRVERRAGELEVTTLAGVHMVADVVIAALGSRPRTRLARDAGLDVARGIVVDSGLRTSAADIFALGECAQMAGRLFTLPDDTETAGRVLAGVLSGQPGRMRWQARVLRLQLESCPVAICEPPPLAGEWHESATARGVRALFHDVGGALRGFALVGEATAETQRLLGRVMR